MRLFEGTPFDIPPTCDRCGEREEDCRCPPPEPAPPEWQAPETLTFRLAIEKRKKGKVVTILRGVTREQFDLDDLVTRLKTTCGAGGTLQGDSIEIQGKHVERIRTFLSQLGFRVKG